MTRIMKVFQVECVVPNLISAICRKFPFTYLEFKDKYRRANQQYNIYTSSHARNSILKINSTLIG